MSDEVRSAISMPNIPDSFNQEQRAYLLDLERAIRGIATGRSFITGLTLQGFSTDGPGFLDEDNMASDSDTAAPSQQSLKAYVGCGTESASASAETTTTSATYTDLDSMSAEVTGLNGSKMLILFSCIYSNDTLGQTVSFKLLRDSTQLILRDALYPADAAYEQVMALNYLDDADGEAHTYKIQWSVSGSTGRVYDRDLTVIEVKK